MYKYILFIAVIFTQLIAGYDVYDVYDVGDQISSVDQNLNFDYCYPSDSLSSTFSFVKHSGKVIMIEMSATW